MDYSRRKIIGLTEIVKLRGSKTKKLEAKVDSGATKSSIDIKLAEELNLGPVVSSKMVKSASGNKLRPVVQGEIEIAGKKIKTELTIADRSHVKYKVLIGLNTMGKRFLIDPMR